MHKSIIRGIVFFALCTIGTTSYAQCEDADFVVSSQADVGLWDSIWNDGYVDAAYAELADDLDSRGYLDDADVIVVNFVYTIHVWFFSGTGITTNMCLVRDPSQTWSDVVNAIANGSALAEVVQTDYDSNGGAGGADGDFWDENDAGDINDWIAEQDEEDWWPDDWSVEIEDFVGDYYEGEKDPEIEM